MIDSFLKSIRPGAVRLVRGLDGPQVASLLQQWSEQPPEDDLRIVACTWERLPAVSEILEQAIDALARSALALWPEWHGRRGAGQALAGDDMPPNVALPANVSRAWLRTAMACCRKNRLPRLAAFPSAIEAAQLASAIEPGRLHLVLASVEHRPAGDKLLGLARAAEWLATSTGARVAVLIPSSAYGIELDGISFDAIDLPAPPAPPISQAAREKPDVWVWPLQGHPHPNSLGEQMLAKRLESDAELAPLFACNQPVRTVRGSRYLVDLLWLEGKVIVEIDGYFWHHTPAVFSQDRQRDYELTISGYLVLRLSHDEVIDDVGIAVEKIRDVVNFRRGRKLAAIGDHV